MKHGKQPVIHTLHKGEEVVLTIRACERYSMQRIAVKPDEAYMIDCEEGQRWYDLIMPSSPDGYFNFIAPLFGLRVKGIRCFCLCGAWNMSDNRAFSIGTESVVAVASEEGTLSFFANDVWGYEWNNWGSIRVRVRRTV